jgi:hypothetical protein
MIYETKASKTAILDLLKKPAQDKSIQNLLLVFRFDFPSSDMSLFDYILQMIVDYITLIYETPECFEFEESQQKEFNRWKQEILENLSLIVQQINIALNIQARKKTENVNENSFSE